MAESAVAAAAFLKNSDDYSPLEIQKLQEFRKNVGSILETEEQRTDAFLIRWLRARNLDLSKAETMLQNSLKWRRENAIDTILEREAVPEDIKAMSPVAFCGISKEGYAVLICPFGRHDARYGLEKYGLEACERFQLISMEEMSKHFHELGNKCGKNVTQVIEILDCEGYSYRQMASKLSREFMVKMQVVMDNHYPELLRYAIIVNAPKIFSVLFAMLKPFIPKATLEKIDIYGPEPEKWKAVLQKRFPVEKIPPHWGGTLVGVDEYCSGNEIWVQGPKDMRAFMHGLTEADADFHKTIVNARDKLIKSIEVTEKGTILEWKFKTDNHDIAFQLTFEPSSNGTPDKISNGSNSPNNSPKRKGSKEKDSIIDVVPYARVDAHSAVQEGSHVCEMTGKYCFIFDNSFSYMKAKTLLYQVHVVDAEHQEHPEKFEDCPEI